MSTILRGIRSESIVRARAAERRSITPGRFLWLFRQARNKVGELVHINKICTTARRGAAIRATEDAGLTDLHCFIVGRMAKMLHNRIYC